MWDANKVWRSSRYKIKNLITIVFKCEQITSLSSTCFKYLRNASNSVMTFCLSSSSSNEPTSHHPASPHQAAHRISSFDGFFGYLLTSDSYRKNPPLVHWTKTWCLFQALCFLDLQEMKRNRRRNSLKNDTLLSLWLNIATFQQIYRRKKKKLTLSNVKPYT